MVRSGSSIFVVALGCLLFSAACSDDPPALPDSGPAPDGNVIKEAGSDALQADLLVPDVGPGQDADMGPGPDLDPGPDQGKVDGPPVTQPDRKEGEITAGAMISGGGSYTLFSQVGHAIGPAEMSGGGYTMQWNAAVIPW